MSRKFRLFLLLIITSPLTIAGQEPAAEEQPNSVWLRQLVSLKPDAAEGLRLHVAASTPVTVYFNGQRLARNVESGNECLVWEVTPLVRSGRNSVAVSAASDVPPKVSAWLKPKSGTNTSLTSWKAAPAPPPVGWQTTDFNDRDWQPAKTAVIEGAEDRRSHLLNWSAARKRRTEKFQLQDGDHVVLLGGTFVERAQQFGHLECALQSGSSAGVTFRNLGWSADTVYAESRGIFDAPEKGYERMIEHVRAEEPTVILLCYGQNEAMGVAGPDAEERFRTGLKKLHADLAPTGAEIVFLSPHAFVSMKSPLPNPVRWNSSLQRFMEIVQDTAEGADATFVNLFTSFAEEMAVIHVMNGESRMLPLSDARHPQLYSERNALWTDNGMHWNETGYQAASYLTSSRLFGGKQDSPRISIDPAAKKLTVIGGKVRNVIWNRTEGTVIRLEYRANSVTPFPLRVTMPEGASGFRVTVGPDNPSGQSEALGISKVDNAAGAHLSYQATTTQAYDRLRALVVRKNELYFHRWRPQNITYLFGFRKHEQGNNASEIAQFDPLIHALEKSIQAAREPQWQKIEVRAKD